MPPNSLAEWMIGQNIPRQKRESQRRDVLRFEISTDDEYDTDTLLVTYPRTRRPGPAPPTRTDYGTKQVRFENHPRRSALKPTPSHRLPAFNDANVDERPWDELAGRTKKLKNASKGKSRKSMHNRNMQTTSDSSDEDADPDPHPACPCSDCTVGRGKLKKAGKWPKEAHEYDEGGLDAKSRKLKSSSTAKNKGSRKGKPNGNNDNSESESTSSDSSESEAEARDDRETSTARKPSKKKSKEKKSSKGQKQGKPGDSQKDNPAPQKDTVDQKPAPQSPHDLRWPNLIMPVKSQVLQVEHAVERPEDPRPNAFVDNQNGVCRIYHGPAYGNPFGYLYPQRTSTGPPLPVGVPHPLKNPYYYGFDQHRDQEAGAYPNMPAGFPPGFVPPMGAHQVPYPYPAAQPPPPPPPAAAAAPVGQDAAPPANNVTPDRQPQYGFSGIPPLGLLSPRAIEARFSQEPQSDRSKDKDKGWGSNVGPSPPQGNGDSSRSNPRHSPNNNNGGGGNNNSPGFGQSGSNSGNAQPGAGVSANDIGGEGWGGGWDTNNNSAGADNGWGGGGGGWSGGSNRNSPQPANGWGGSVHNSPQNSNGQGGAPANSPQPANGWGGGSNRSNHSQPNTGWGDTTAAQPGNGGWGDGGGASRQNSPNGGGSDRANNMPGAWHFRGNNAVPGSRPTSTAHNSPRGSQNGNQGAGGWGGSASGGGDYNWGGGGGWSGNGNDGGNKDNNNGWGDSGGGNRSSPIPPWGDPTAAQVSQPSGGW